MKRGRSRYYGHRFPSEIISCAVWVYHRFCLSFRDVEDLPAQRGIKVSYETIRIWCQKFGPGYVRSLKRRQGAPATAGTWTKSSFESMAIDTAPQESVVNRQFAERFFLNRVRLTILFKWARDCNEL